MGGGLSRAFLLFFVLKPRKSSCVPLGCWWQQGWVKVVVSGAEAQVGRLSLQETGLSRCEWFTEAELRLWFFCDWSTWEEDRKLMPETLAWRSPLGLPGGLGGQDPPGALFPIETSAGLGVPEIPSHSQELIS